MNFSTGSPFTFTRIRYYSGDRDAGQRMPSNILHSLLEYTTIPLNLQEQVVDLGSPDLFQFPFTCMSGHRLVQIDAKESACFKQYGENGALFSWTTATTTSRPFCQIFPNADDAPLWSGCP